MTDRSGPLDDLERFIDRLTEHFEPVTRSLERGDDDHADRRLGLPAWEMPSMPSQGSGMTSLDLTDEGDEFVVTVDVPGYDTTDLEVRLDGPSLLISGDHEQETTQTASATEYVRQERHVQSFTRQVTLPAAVESDEVHATVNNGILTVQLPKRAHASGDDSTTIDID